VSNLAEAGFNAMMNGEDVLQIGAAFDAGRKGRGDIADILLEKSEPSVMVLSSFHLFGPPLRARGNLSP
jgi:hypothetical protein